MPAEPSEAVGKGIDKKRELSSKRTYTMALFSGTLFISAALLFLVEPMFAKFVLPTFGGTPAVWTGSMMFFQATLLVSYLYVHVTAEWLGARRQAAVHLVMALLTLLVLPIAVPAEEWAPPAQSSPLLLGRLRWVGLAFVPSSFMLGVTAFITTDITPVPLLWVIPLSLYLFSFVVVFSRSQRVPGIVHKVMVVLLPVMMTLLAVTILSDLKRPYWALILLHLFGFFVAGVGFEGELARERPPARHLTEFYLWVAVGGVLGGVFNALVAPVVFCS